LTYPARETLPVAGIALRVPGVLKPPHHDKVEPPRRRILKYNFINYTSELLISAICLTIHDAVPAVENMKCGMRCEDT
jgi:hypothetical protein